jgi:hypothetical protein
MCGAPRVACVCAPTLTPKGACGSPMSLHLGSGRVGLVGRSSCSREQAAIGGISAAPSRWTLAAAVDANGLADGVALDVQARRVAVCRGEITLADKRRAMLRSWRGLRRLRGLRGLRDVRGGLPRRGQLAGRRRRRHKQPQHLAQDCRVEGHVPVRHARQLLPASLKPTTTLPMPAHREAAVINDGVAVAGDPLPHPPAAHRRRREPPRARRREARSVKAVRRHGRRAEAAKESEVAADDRGACRKVPSRLHDGCWRQRLAVSAEP